MKTAIILTGLNRSKLNYYLNHKEIIDKYNADVYISTYNTPKENGYLSIQEMLDLYTPIKIDIEEYSRIEPQFQKLVDNIQWRDYQIKNQFRFVPKPINVCSMWYKIQKGFDIIDNEYDVYIRMRFDNTFDKVIIEENNFLNFPLQSGHSGICDQFAFGNYNNMKEYCHTYDKLEDYIKSGGEFHSETIVKNLNEHLKINYQDMRFYLNLNLQVV